MTMNLSTKLLVSTLAIGGLFVAGTYALQSVSEKTVLATAEKHEQTKVSKQSDNTFADIETLSLKEYYIDELKFDPKLMDALIEKYGDEINRLTMKDMLDGSQKEKVMYVDALHTFFDLGEQPILAKNELTEENEDGRQEVVLNNQGEYAYSLETSLSDTNALSSEIDSTNPIIEICKKHGIDPEGKINDLTAEIIIEIDQKLYEISDHPKN